MIKINCYDANDKPITAFTQWDVNQTIVLKVDGSFTVDPDVHFCNQNSGEALVVSGTDVSVSGGNVSVKVPNVLLQEPYPIMIYMYVYSGDKTAAGTPAKSIASARIHVTKRARPSEYKYAETIDGSFLEEVDAEIRAMISAAVEEAEERIATDISAAEERIEEDIAATDVGILMQRMDAAEETENAVVNSAGAKYDGWTSGHINTAEEPVDITDIIANALFHNTVIPCNAGEVFSVAGIGGFAPRLWTFIDAEGKILGRSEAYAEGPCVVSAPENAAYLICHSNLTAMPDSAVYKITKPSGVSRLALRTDELEETGGYMVRYKNLIYGKTRVSYSIKDNTAKNVNLHTVETGGSGTIPRNGGYAIEQGHRYLVFITADVTFTGTVETGAKFQPHVKIGDAPMDVCQTFIKHPDIRDTDGTRIEISGLYTASQDATLANAAPCAMANGCGTKAKSITLAYDKVCLIDVTDIDYQKVLDLLRSYESNAAEFVITQKETIGKNVEDISGLNARVGAVEPIAAELTQRIETIAAAESVVLSGTTTKYDNWESGYIATNGDTADINSRIESNTYKSMVIHCSEGDIFYISLLGGNIARGWAFVDSDGTVLERSTTATDICFAKAPVGSAYLVLNHSYTLQEENPIYKITDPKSVVALTLCADNLEETGGYMKRYKNLAFGRQRTSEYSKTKTAGSSGTAIDFYCGTLTTSTGTYNAQHGLTVEADRDYLVYIAFAVKSVSGYTKGTLYPRVRIGTNTTSITNKKTVNAAGLAEGSEFELYGIYHSSDLRAFIFPHMQITGIDNTIEQDITFSFEKVCFIDITGMTDSEMTELIKLIRSYETDAAEFVVTQKETIAALDTRIGDVEELDVATLSSNVDELEARVDAISGGYEIKSHLKDEYDVTLRKLQDLMMSENDRVSFAFFTDLHYHFADQISDADNRTYHDPVFNMLSAVRRLSREFPLACAVAGGDYIAPSAAVKQDGINVITELHRALSGIDAPHIALSGNHEHQYFGNSDHPGAELTWKEIYKILCKKYVSNDIRQASENVYYMIDNANSIFWLYISNVADLQQLPSQITSGINIALAANTENYPVVVMNHFSNHSGTSPSISVSVSPTIDYIKNQNAEIEIIAWIGGHCHADEVAVYNNVPVISCLQSAYLTSSHTNTSQDGTDYVHEIGTATESAFSVLTIDKTLGKIYCTRFGLGKDRVINYNDKNGQTIGLAEADVEKGNLARPGSTLPFTENGVTFSYDGDVYSISGTQTDTVSRAFANIKNVKPNTTYTYKVIPLDGCGYPNLYIWDGASSSMLLNGGKKKRGMFTTGNDVTSVGIAYTTNGDTTNPNYQFRLMVAEGAYTEAKMPKYEPYKV